MPASSIDDLLLHGSAAEAPVVEPEIEEAPIDSEDAPQAEEHDPGYDEVYDASDNTPDDKETQDAREHSEDDYGNKTEELSKNMQRRLERQAESLRRKHEMEMAQLRAQLTPQQQNAVKQAERQFEADPNSSDDWQQQLDSYIEQTVMKMQGKRERDAQEAQERKLQADFEKKFFTGMQKFDDFTDVISSLPCDISDPMTYATRSMSDPAAFLYAAAKRHPAELERIAKIRDPYAQVAEMGRLEERMRRNKASTQAPRPLGRSVEDAQTPAPKTKKEDTIEDLIAKSQAKKLSQIKQRRGVRGVR